MDPVEFIRHANRIIKSKGGAPKQVDLRRSISASYYALFHAFCGATADDLIGSTATARKSAAHLLVYRAFEHANALKACEDAAKETLPEKIAAVLGHRQFPEEIRLVAKAFVELQDLRHKADYNPTFRFYKSDALGASVRAAFAVLRLRAADSKVRRIFLLLMLFKTR